jgi:L-alanine-DL-glutamate epimerase-like enolase superfamily enzyme
MLVEPVYRLLGYRSAEPKLAYALQLFGTTAQEAETRARSARKAGFRAVKFVWISYGHGMAAEDEAHVEAARASMRQDAHVLIDAGQVFAQDVAVAAERMPALERYNVLRLEEPFLADALAAYAALAGRSPMVKMAGGESCHSTPNGAQPHRFRQASPPP